MEFERIKERLTNEKKSSNVLEKIGKEKVKSTFTQKGRMFYEQISRTNYGRTKLRNRIHYPRFRRDSNRRICGSYMDYYGSIDASCSHSGS